MMAVKDWGPQAAGLGALASLTYELLEHIFLAPSLSARDLLSLSATSHILNVLCLEEPLWMKHCLRGYNMRLTYAGSWLKTACVREFGVPGTIQRYPLPGFYSDHLYRRWLRCHMDVAEFVPPGRSQIDVHATLTPDEFDVQFDILCKPVVFTGLIDRWPAKAWTRGSLVESYGKHRFKTTTPFGGDTYMTLEDFMQYGAVQADEEPLYIFDAAFGETAPELLAEYSVPPVFQQDLLRPLGHRAPDYRWLVVGPPRSGSPWHIDPAFTSAWNALIYGRKRWALYPPDYVPPGVTWTIDGDGVPDFHSPSSLIWFLEVYPQLPPEQKPLEFVQKPGEVIFVPRGWWHCVLNLDHTAAVTQNFCSPASLPLSVEWMARGASPHLERLGLSVPMGTDDAHLRPGETVLDEEVSTSEKVLTPAFVHCRRLGPWLGALYRLQPQLQEHVLDPSRTYAELEAWNTVLHYVASCQKLGAARDDEAWPIGGGSCVVFRVGRHVVKFFCKDDQNTAPYLWQTEVLSSLMLARAPAFVRSQAPVLTGYGIVPQYRLPPALAPVGGCALSETSKSQVGSSSEEAGSSSRHAAGRPDSEVRGHVDDGAFGEPQRGQPEDDVAFGERQRGLPYVVMTLVPGQSLETCRKELQSAEWESVAQQLGTLLAGLHSAPLPSPADVASTATLRDSVRVATTAERGTSREDEGVVPDGHNRGSPEECGEEGPEGPEGPREETLGSCVQASTRAAGDQASRKSLGDQASRKSLGASLGSGGEAGAVCAGDERQRKRQRVTNGWSKCAHACARETQGSRPALDTAEQGRRGKTLDAAVSGAFGADVSGAGAGFATRLHGERSDGCALWRERSEGCALWHDDEGHVWQYSGGAHVDGSLRPSGSVSEPRHAATGSGPRSARTNAGHVTAAECATSCPQEPGAVVGDGDGPGNPWGPFVSFLNRRRSIVGTMLEGSGLPLRFVTQAKALLAMDAWELMPSSGRGPLGTAAAPQPACGSSPCAKIGCEPCWVHGDLTSENVLIQRPLRLGGSPRVSIVDFADGGHGDPAYELVMLFLCVFRGRQHFAELFMRSYLRSWGRCNGGQRPAWLASRGGLPLSHVALVYCLLHEQDALPRLFKLFPDLWNAPSLQDIAKILRNQPGAGSLHSMTNVPKPFIGGPLGLKEGKCPCDRRWRSHVPSIPLAGCLTRRLLCNPWELGETLLLTSGIGLSL